MNAVIFDLDGTLIDSAPDLLEAANAMLSDAGADPLDLATLRGFIGNGTPKLVERCLRARGLPAGAPEVTEAHGRYMAYYNAEPAGRTVLYPGVTEALDALSAAGFRLGVCTNKPEAPARAILKHFGMDGLFGAVFGGDSLPLRKPDPAPLFATLDALGGGDALFVGDSEIDAETAVAAALPFALFTEGYRKSPVAALPHAFAFSDFAALPGFATRLRAA